MIADDFLRKQANLLNLELADVTGDAELLAGFLGYLNDALRELERFADWPWLYTRVTLTTTAGADELTLPADFVAWLNDDLPYLPAQGAFEYASREKISRLRRVSGTPAGGRPFLWAMAYNGPARRHQMTLWPRPDNAYDIVAPYRRRVPALATRGDTPAFPEEFESVLALGAMAQTEEQHERMEAGTKRGAFQAALQAAWAQYGSAVRTQHQGRLRAMDEADEDTGDSGGGDMTVVHVTS